MTKRRTFSNEFKREAVGLAHQPGTTVSHVASDIGIGDGLLSRWHRELAADKKKALSGSGVPRDQEMAALKVRADTGKEGERFFARCGRVHHSGIELKYQTIQRCRRA